MNSELLQVAALRYGIYLIVTFVLVVIVLAFLRRKQVIPGWSLGVALGVTGALLVHKLATDLTAFLPLQTSSPSSQSPSAPLNTQDTQVNIQQLRVRYFTEVETAISAENAPNPMPPSFKEELVRKYSGLFPNGKIDQQVLLRELERALQCQKLFLEDGLASLKAKKLIVSDARTECEKSSGALFGRERLVPSEIAAKNNELIQQSAAAPKSAKKGSETDSASATFTQPALTKALETQGKKLERLQSLLDN